MMGPEVVGRDCSDGSCVLATGNLRTLGVL
jgi:hypothetical protein